MMAKDLHIGPSSVIRSVKVGFYMGYQDRDRKSEEKAQVRRASRTFLSVFLYC